MKKFMFTALALVAFSGVSMANEIAEKDMVRQPELTCEEFAMLATNIAEEQHQMDTGECFTSEQWNDVYSGLVADC